MGQSSSKLHLGQLALVLNLIKGLKNNGVNVSQLINQSKLRYFELSDPEAYVPLPVIYDFVAIVKKAQGIANTNITFQDYLHVDAMGNFGQLVTSCVRLLPAIQSAIKFQKVQMTHENPEYGIEGKKAFYRNRFSTPFTKEETFIDDLELGMQLDMLRYCNGPDWSPDEIHIRGTDTTLIEHRFPDYKGKIMVNQDFVGVTFDISVLAKPLVYSPGSNTPIDRLATPPLTLSGKIEELFNSTRFRYLPTLDQIADMFDTSPSDIKRTLHDEGTSYSALTERWRFMKGVVLLTHSQLKINEISEQLYYANPSNFIRAFKRWTGLLPNQFR